MAVAQTVTTTITRSGRFTVSHSVARVTEAVCVATSWPSWAAKPTFELVDLTPTQAIFEAIGGSWPATVAVQLWDNSNILAQNGESLTTVGTDADSRDNPSSVFICRNEGLPNNPEFCFGNPYVAGVGLEACGIWYRDDLDPDWKICVSIERSGTWAAVLDGVRRSNYEGFINNGGEKPWFRIEASSQAFNVGAGDAKCLAGNAVRSGGTLTITTETEHKFSAGQQLYKQGGDAANFGADGANWGPSGTTRTVAAVISPTQFTVVDARGDYTSTTDLNFSAETDVGFGRDSNNVAAVRVNNSSVAKFDTTGVKIPTGLVILSEGSALGLGASGTAPAEVTASKLHVKEGYQLHNEGAYVCTGWYNGGGQTQTSQEVFVVGTGSGAKSTYLPAIGGTSWKVLRIKNKKEGGAGNNLTIYPDGSDTVDEAASLVLAPGAAVTLISNGTNWEAWKSPA